MSNPWDTSQEVSDHIDSLREENRRLRMRLESIDNPEMVLDKPAQVGGGCFHAGVKWSTVIASAQRVYEVNQSERAKANPEAFLNLLKRIHARLHWMRREDVEPEQGMLVAVAMPWDSIFCGTYEAKPFPRVRDLRTGTNVSEFDWWAEIDPPPNLTDEEVDDADPS